MLAIPNVTVRVAHPGEAGGPLRYVVLVERTRRTDAVTVRLPTNATVVEGFDPAGDGTYTLDARTGRLAFAAGADGENHFVASGWAYAPAPDVRVGVRSGGRARCLSPFDRGSPAAVVAADGAVRHTATGLYVGVDAASFTEAAVLVHDRPVSVVVPGEVAVDVDPGALAARLRSLSGLPCGSSAPVALFVLPTEARDGGFAVDPRGDRAETLWVEAGSARDAGADDVLRHEYVHACQDFRAGPDLEWFDEASADHFASLAAHRAGDATPADLRASVAYDTLAYADPAAADERDDAPVLADPATDGHPIQYTHGEAVVLALDAELRTHGRSVAALLAWLNRRSGTVDYAAFRSRVVAWTNDATGRWLDSVVLEPTPVDPPRYVLPDGRDAARARPDDPAVVTVLRPSARRGSRSAVVPRPRATAQSPSAAVPSSPASSARSTPFRSATVDSTSPARRSPTSSTRQSTNEASSSGRTLRSTYSTRPSAITTSTSHSPSSGSVIRTSTQSSRVSSGRPKASSVIAVVERTRRDDIATGVANGSTPPAADTGRLARSVGSQQPPDPDDDEHRPDPDEHQRRVRPPLAQERLARRRRVDVRRDGPAGFDPVQG